MMHISFTGLLGLLGIVKAVVSLYGNVVVRYVVGFRLGRIVQVGRGTDLF
jgi:hypothetical protein